MELPVLITPLPDERGFAARIAGPIDLSAEAATADEAQVQLASLLEERLKQGVELRSLHVATERALPPGGWLPDDELTHEWLQHMQEYRAECDAADRARLESESESEPSA